MQVNESLDILTVICANDAYGILRVEMQKQGCTMPKAGSTSEKLTSLSDPLVDWVSLAAAYGLRATLVDTVDEFEEHFVSALRTRGPRAIVAKL